MLAYAIAITALLLLAEISLAWRTHTTVVRRATRIHSTTVAPPKIDRTKRKQTEKESEEVPLFSFKENTDDEAESFSGDQQWMVILYNDPINKRLYVQNVLMEVFSFSEAVAHETMMLAHTYGFSVCGEWYKELAEEYSKQLQQRGLIAEAKPAGGNDDKD